MDPQTNEPTPGNPAAPANPTTPASTAANAAPAAPAGPVEQPKPHRHSLLLWLLVLLFVVYPLSSGPVMKLWSVAGFSPDPILGFYAPLIYLAFYSEGFRRLLIWYLHLWKTELMT